jgi:hypothetical protein
MNRLLYPPPLPLDELPPTGTDLDLVTLVVTIVSTLVLGIGFLIVRDTLGLAPFGHREEES